MQTPPAASQRVALVHVCTAAQPERPWLQTSRLAPLQSYWLGAQAGLSQAPFVASQSAVVAHVVVVVQPVSGPAHVWSDAPLH